MQTVKKYIVQKDFDSGTLIISKPGTYILSENIKFNPNPDNDWFPRENQLKSNGGIYDDFAYRFGFFTAIAISASDVILDLNNKIIEQSLEHRIQQRFFSCIELSNQPFPSKKGPANFGNSLISTNNCIIKNGTIGASSHHGIHGNNNNNITLKNITITKFEIAGISLNKINNLVIDNVTITDNNKNVPILGTYSAGRFIRSFIKNIINNTESKEIKKEGFEKLHKLELELNQTFNEIMNGKRITSDLYRNDSKLVDGLSIGILLNNQVNVDDFIISNDNRISNITIKNSNIYKLKNSVIEIVSLASGEKQNIFKGPTGSALQIHKITDKNGYYKQNSLAEVQFFIAKYGKKLTEVGRNSIPSDMIDWHKSNDITLKKLMLNNKYQYQYNGDTMHHLLKGLIGIKIDCCDNLNIINCNISDVINFSNLGYSKNIEYIYSHNKQVYSKGYSGCICRGISIHNCKDVNINNVNISVIKSRNGSSIACDVFNQSTNVNIDNLHIDKIYAGRKNLNDKWEGVDYDNSYVNYVNKYPNLYPTAYGLRVLDDSTVSINNISISNYIKSVGEFKKITLN